MTDQLRQALAAVDRGTFTRPSPVIIDAARAWLEFPTDAQVEAAAQAIHGDPQNSEMDERCRTLARAALEAAHNTDFGSEP